MRVLVTNDDGVESPGLAVLTRAALDAGLDVVVAAPAEQSSGASAAIIATRENGRTPVTRVTLPDTPDVEAYAVQAQPGHIVLAALRGWLDPVPELVLSGINHGANVGRAVLHSGTVGAALTAGVVGVRALAVSLDVALHPEGDRHWSGAAKLLPDVLDLLAGTGAGTVLSLNVPDRPQLRDLRHATLAPFGTVQTRVDSADDSSWQLAEVEVEDEPADGSDSALLAAGHPTLTALSSVSEDTSVDLAQLLR
ncbi:5'/3'-nucleotidase SurE [Pseudonocardia sp. TRM90224]|uniref:5'/3'-nucleotidase SurE n=1 Tax=Pseudonocardia sp. TRM90224 TaxID=2812678 RepID=UPI001E3784FF|nr:5'/3'-nucleotidase SurE [Pseudonocardia sp. TRM90224]